MKGDVQWGCIGFLCSPLGLWGGGCDPREGCGASGAGQRTGWRVTWVHMSRHPAHPLGLGSPAPSEAVGSGFEIRGVQPRGAAGSVSCRGTGIGQGGGTGEQKSSIGAEGGPRGEANPPGTLPLALVPHHPHHHPQHPHQHPHQQQSRPAAGTERVTEGGDAPGRTGTGTTGGGCPPPAPGKPCPFPPPPPPTSIIPYPEPLPCGRSRRRRLLRRLLAPGPAETEGAAGQGGPGRRERGRRGPPEDAGGDRVKRRASLPAAAVGPHLR